MDVDYLEERDGRLHTYEFKWNPKKKAKPPMGFVKAYAETDFSLVNRENFQDFVIVNRDFRSNNPHFSRKLRLNNPFFSRMFGVNAPFLAEIIALALSLKDEIAKI
ncbi:hypothetical protein CEQ90_17465 [Lewinellaceae bacterium SD302]|nr:hypothetical protein CEQ90_17465 [Lewinellaceae bacterium SD302]